MNEGADGTQKKIKDYKKTSLLKSVVIFEQFIRSLEKDMKAKENKEGMVSG